MNPSFPGKPVARAIDTSEFDPLLLERAARVRMLALDVDGVLTDGSLYFDNQGNEMKAFSTRDGLGMRYLADNGVTLALITGRRSRIVDHHGLQQVSAALFLDTAQARIEIVRAVAGRDYDGELHWSEYTLNPPHPCPSLPLRERAGVRPDYLRPIRMNRVYFLNFSSPSYIRSDSGAWRLKVARSGTQLKCSSH